LSSNHFRNVNPPASWEPSPTVGCSRLSRAVGPAQRRAFGASLHPGLVTPERWYQGLVTPKVPQVVVMKVAERWLRLWTMNETDGRTHRGADGLGVPARHHPLSDFSPFFVITPQPLDLYISPQNSHLAFTKSNHPRPNNRPTPISILNIHSYKLGPFY